MHFIPQISENGCGYACLKMMLVYAFKNDDYAYIHEDEDIKSLSFKDLCDISSSYGLTLTGYKVNDKKDIIGSSCFPFIASYKLSNGKSHAVVVEKIFLGRVFILDPEKGSTDISLKEFYRLWDGNLLRIDNKEETNKPELTIKPLKKRDYFWMYVLEFISFSSIIVGLFFINETVKIYLPLAFFLLYALSDVLLKWYQMKLMKKIDSYFMDLIKVNTKRRDFLLRIENYKKNVLSDYFSLISDIFLCISIVVLAIMNGTKNVVLLIVPLALALLVVLIINPMLRKQKSSLDQEEIDLEKIKDNIQYTKKYEEVHSLSYKYGELFMIKRIIVVFIIILNSILLMFLTKTTYLPYIVFYSCLQYCLFESLVRICEFKEKRKETLLWKSKLYNLFNK